MELNKMKKHKLCSQTELSLTYCSGFREVIQAFRVHYQILIHYHCF